MADASAPPAVVSTTPRALLEKNGVDESVITFLGASGCTELASFSNWVELKAELKQAVLDKTPRKDNPGELAKLKQAWREAEALNARTFKRSAGGLQGEGLDSPLDSDVQKQVEDNFRKAYGWPGLPSRQVACDSLLGRVKREFERRQPSMFAILRVRTLAQAQRAQPLKTRRLSESVSLQLGEGEDDTPSSTNGLYAWLLLFQVLCTTWAVVGCFDSEAGSGKRDRFAHWAQICEYYSEVAYRAHEAAPPLHRGERRGLDPGGRGGDEGPSHRIGPWCPEGAVGQCAPAVPEGLFPSLGGDAHIPQPQGQGRAPPAARDPAAARAAPCPRSGPGEHAAASGCPGSAVPQ